MAEAPDVSVVVPARNEAGTVPRTLAALREQETEYDYEVVVVDGASTDDTAAVAAAHGARVVEGTGESIAAGRNRGAEATTGEWLLFVDADTVLHPTYLQRVLPFAEHRGLAAASARCRVDGVRATLMQATINHVFPRLRRPILPGFDLLVRRDAFEAVGGFPDVPNEDTAFSRLLGKSHATGYHPAVLVETSGRRIHASGLTGTLWHYLRLDVRRLLADY